MGFIVNEEVGYLCFGEDIVENFHNETGIS